MAALISIQASATPCSIAVLISGESLPGSKVLPSPTPILARRALNSISEGWVGANAGDCSDMEELQRLLLLPPSGA